MKRTLFSITTLAVAVFAMVFAGGGGRTDS